MLTDEDRIKIISEIEKKVNYIIEENSEQEEKEINKRKQWDNFYIKNQIEERMEKGNSFTCGINDCIKAMVYSYLSSQNEWHRVENQFDKINDIFCGFNSEEILKKDSEKDPEKAPKELRDALKADDVKLATQSTKKQMTALFKNIKKLKAIQEKYENISDYYDRIIGSKDNLEGYKRLVERLAIKSSDDKMEQMGVALSAEYLRNLGYDIPKPDRHILRILGPDILGEHKNRSKNISDKRKIEIFDIIDKYARATNKSRAEIDYLLWAYCANGYGEVCTKNSPKCCCCKIKEFCKKGKGCADKMACP